MAGTYITTHLRNFLCNGTLLEPDDVRRLLAHVQGLRHPYRNCVMVLLSFHAGIRACEIAGLDWAMVLSLGGCVDELIVLSGGVTKGMRPSR